MKPVDRNGRRADGTGPRDVADLVLQEHEEALLRALAEVLYRREARRERPRPVEGR